MLQDSQAAFRPPEDARFATTPRALYQVILPQAPGEGFIVVYEFPDPRAAGEAAERQAAYLASGPGRVQSAFGVRHVMRLVGSTVLLYTWVPDGAVDPLPGGDRSRRSRRSGSRCRSRPDDPAALTVRSRPRQAGSRTGSGASAATQRRTGSRWTLRVWVRGKSSSGHSRQPAIR